MTTPNPATANASARSQGCAGVGPDDCRYCMRQGLPILPVRYAICQVDENPDVPALPEERIGELYPRDTDGNPIAIDLDTVIDGEGNAVAGQERKNRYILRKLRGGFLYVYDEGNDRWYAYQVTDTAELLQFRPGEPPEEITPLAFACDQDAHRASASLITLPDAATTGTAWLAFVESPWSEAFWEQVAADAEWRERHMQRFDVEAWLNDGQAEYAFHQAEIATLVPEYLTPGQGADPLSCSAALSQLNGHCLAPRLEATGSEFDDLQAAMNARIADNRDLEGRAGQGVMLAIKDEVGILEELNDYRHRPIEALRVHQDADEKRPREAQWLASVTKLREALEAEAEKEIKEIDSDLAEEIAAERGTLEEETQQFEAHWKNRLDNAADDQERQQLQRIYEHDKRWAGAPGGLVGFDSVHETAQPQRVAPYRELLRRRTQKIKSVNNRLGKVLAELHKYYDDKKREAIEKRLQEFQDDIDTIVPRMDADYAHWLTHGLRDALDRYDHLSPRYGLRVTEIVGNALRGGVLSASSEWAWEQLLTQLNDAENPIVRAYFHNHRETAEAFVADALALGEGPAFFGEVTLKEWFNLLKGLRDVANSGRSLAEFEASRRALFDLGTTILGAAGALLGQEAADQAAGGRPVAPRSGIMVQYARLLQVDGLVTTPDASFASGASYVVEMEVTMGDYRRLVSYLANPDGSTRRGPDGEPRYVDPLENGARTGGNLPDPDVVDATRVKVLWQIRGSDLARVAGYVEGIDENALTAGGKPITLSLVERQRIMAEQQRLRGRLSSGDKAVQLLDTVFALLSFFEAGKSLSDKPRSLEHWWSLLGAMAALTQLAFERAAGNEVRRGLATSGTLADASILRGAQYGSVARHLGRGVGAIGLIDGFRALGEAGAMARRGELRERVRHKQYLAGVTIGGGILAIAASSLVLIPLVIGVISLVLVYRLARLVPWHIETWLRRSLYGVQAERLRFQPFANGLEEQDSLTMVFSGIEFDMEALRTNFSMQDARAAAELHRQAQADRRELTAEEREFLQGDSPMNLTATSSFPEDLAGELTVIVRYHTTQGDRQFLGGAKYTNGDIMIVDQYGKELASSELEDIGDAQSPAYDGHGFILGEDGERKTMLFETDLEATGGRLVATVRYVPEVGVFPEEDYVMELSR
ncbi:T6SS effector BTH_I2691 family protein [Halomonas mongoliensis]|uniref:T6SS effector BTH_I2691 family protein n=1 Tax=Halomonas mongoliensis TaxID=321265 RepID=UPI00403AD3D1